MARGGDLLVANTEQTWRNEILGWPMLLPVWAHLFTREARQRVEGMAHGTTVARFPPEALTGLDVPILPASSPAIGQAEALLRRAWAAERESEALARLRDTLLPALMSGRIRVREAEELVGDRATG